MARERWFYAKDMRRMGPVPKRQLLECLLALPDPRGCLVWRHGLPAWTPAREVPEIDRQLVPFAKAESPAAREPVRAEPGMVAERRAGPAAADAGAPPRGTGRARQPNVALYFAGLAVLVVVVVAGWIFWPVSRAGGRAGTPDGTPRSGEGSSPSRAGASDPRAAAPGAEGGGDGAGFAGWSDQEADIAPDQLRRLRGVGGWTGERLKITLYNGSTWRVTEIVVRTSELRGEDFVDGETPHRLLPAGGDAVDAGTADLLNKVAPDRKKAGISPLDTGTFEANVGPKPEAYRWRIEGARGYPPRQ